MRAGAAPLAVEADRFALLSDALDPAAVGRVRDLPAGSTDLVVIRRAWTHPGEVEAALVAAMQAVRPGGEVVVADLDARRLVAGPTQRYPVRLLYSSMPDVAERLMVSTASPGLLGAAAVRVGLREVAGYTYDDELSEHEDAASLWAGIRERGWRGSAWVSQDRSGPLFDQLATALARAIPAGSAVDREPWYAVIGSSG